MAREYKVIDHNNLKERELQKVLSITSIAAISAIIVAFLTIRFDLSPWSIIFLSAFVPMMSLVFRSVFTAKHYWLERERAIESNRRGGKPILGLPPNRDAFKDAIDEAKEAGRETIGKYLVGYELDSGEPMWVSDDDICTHACVFAKTGVGKTLWLEGLMFQQMARNRASGFTFIDAKRDPGTLADIVMMALMTGRIEDLIVIDPFDPVCSYNFVFTPQRADVKARKILRCGLPPISDDSPAKHYDRLASDAIYRIVRALESLGLAWSIRDIAVALSAFQITYPKLRSLLYERNKEEALIELGHLASTYRNKRGDFDSAKITENLRGIASELHSIASSQAGNMFCIPRADLSLTDAILRGKIIYYMLPRLEEAESADRMMKVFREDLEVSIGEVTSSRTHHLEDPHMVIIDEGASTFGPTWANLFELARKGRFALLFGAQSISGLKDRQMGLSEEFYQRVIANVNLKVIMRLGDNETAEDMAEWIGKVVKEKVSFGVGTSAGTSSRELTHHLEMNKKASATWRTGVNIQDDEDYLVSPEELKHEMASEKGLAWFDLGDGILRKGRAIWFDSSLPDTWEGREYLCRYEMVEGDDIGIAEWVDEKILSFEHKDEKKEAQKEKALEFPPPDVSGPAAAKAPKEMQGQDNFRISNGPGKTHSGQTQTRLFPNKTKSSLQSSEKETMESEKKDSDEKPEKTKKTKPSKISTTVISQSTAHHTALPSSTEQMTKRGSLNLRSPQKGRSQIQRRSNRLKSGK